MSINKISPIPLGKLGFKALLSDEYMLAFYKKFCDATISRAWHFKRAKNRLYEDENFLRVFFYSEVMGRSIHETSEALNEYLTSRRKGRVKTFADGRKRRLVPHQTEVNKYLRKIGLKKAREILRECLDFQLLEALERKLISRKVDVLIDFTEHPYYGRRKDGMIKGTTRQKGTRKMRHYLGFSILSRGVHLFAGLEQVARGESKIPLIVNFLRHLLELGFKLNFVLMDREFYRAALVKRIKDMSGNVLMPAKNYKKVRSMLEEYLNGSGKRVRKYMISCAPGAKQHHSQGAYLIITAKHDFSLSGIKKAFSSGKTTLAKARSMVFPLLTTEKPKSPSSSWACRNAKFYKKRWQIETGFSDLNRINRCWRSSHDNVRYLDMLARMLLYNSWKMNKKLLEIAAKKASIQPRLTLFQNQDYLNRSFLMMEKKSRGVISQA